MNHLFDNLFIRKRDEKTISITERKVKKYTFEKK